MRKLNTTHKPAAWMGWLLKHWLATLKAKSRNQTMAHPMHKLEWQRAWDAECARREAEAEQKQEQWLEGRKVLNKLKHHFQCNDEKLKIVERFWVD